MPGLSTQGRADQRHASSDNANLTTVVEAMIRSSKQRRDARRSALSDEYQACIAQMDNDISDVFSDHGDKALQLHMARLERLIELLKRKEEIERRMATSIKTLERAYLARSTALEAALDGRMAELH